MYAETKNSDINLVLYVYFLRWVPLMGIAL